MQSHQHVCSTQHNRPRLACLTKYAQLTQTTNHANALHFLELPLSKLFIDDTGSFPIGPSSRGHQYIMVAYHYDANAILIQPFATHHDSHCIPAYNKLMRHLQASRFQPSLQRNHHDHLEV